MTVPISRERWVGYRWRRHGLGVAPAENVLGDLLLLGLQGGRQSGGEQALGQRVRRVGSISVSAAIRPVGPLVSMWSVRGAPHAHDACRLDIVRDALAPLDSDPGDHRHVAAVQEVASAMTAIVTGKTAKGDLSREVGEAVSSSLVQHCPRCQVRHFPDGLFRAAGRQAQLVIGPDEDRRTMLYPCPDVAQEQVDDPRSLMLQTYFRVNGPTTRTQYRDWQEAGSAGVAQLWDQLDEEDKLVRVELGGRRFDLPGALVDPIETAEPAEGVALVPPNDPYLRQTDRTVLVPDRARRKEIFKALSGPGALLVDGEVAGAWRYRRSDAEVSIELFDGLSTSRTQAVKRAAALVATSIGDEEPAVTYVD